MNDYGRNLIKIVKTKEQAEYDKEHPYMEYVCPECSESLPLIPHNSGRKKKLNNKCITIDSVHVESFWTDFCYDFLLGYYKQVYVDNFVCCSCGAEWKSGRYKCLQSEKTELLADRKIRY